jgi:hypothetical protein
VGKYGRAVRRSLSATNTLTFTCMCDLCQLVMFYPRCRGKMQSRNPARNARSLRAFQPIRSPPANQNDISISSFRNVFCVQLRYLGPTAIGLNCRAVGVHVLNRRFCSLEDSCNLFLGARIALCRGEFRDSSTSCLGSCPQPQLHDRLSGSIPKYGNTRARCYCRLWSSRTSQRTSAAW